MTEIRQSLHQIPEVGFHEKKTAQFVLNYLATIEGLEITSGIAGTGVTALLKTGRPGKTLLIRADMDALPIHEETGLSFASIHKNTMHACGHDGNMTMALVTARILSWIKDRFSGNVKFIFQPAEEGPGGAKPMIEQGILENPSVDYSVAAHLWPDLPQGTLGIKSGVLMSAASVFEIEIKGNGGHGAMPHRCVDALDTAVQVVNALQRVVSRKLDPMAPSVVTIGSLHAGSAPNTIPEKAFITGTTRTFDNKTWNDYPNILEPVIKGVCDSMGASYTFKFLPGYPPLENDPCMVAILKKSMRKVVPGDLIREPESTMGGEDMAFVLEKTKGCLFLVGTGFEGCAPLHNSKFNFDESNLLLGVETFINFTLDLLA
ncbi:MAG: amidohydrolase [Desulfobacteraceae bacterium]|nr:amidohydrolase [Desulfobacteraceae bacterium]